MLVEESVTKATCLAWRLPRDFVVQILGSSGGTTILSLEAGTSMRVNRNSICDLIMSSYLSESLSSLVLHGLHNVQAG